jgi:glycosyltransferase 2 family protein
VNVQEVAQALRQVNPWLILLGVALATLTFVLRIFRWQLLLRDDQGGTLPALPLWHAIAMGFMANNVLPLRMGEVVRTFAAHRLTGVRFTAALASIAVERLFDALTVLLLLGIGLLFAGLPPGSAIGRIPVGGLVTGVAILVLAGFAVAGAVLAFPRLAERVARRLIPSQGLADRVLGLIEGIRQGLGVLTSPGRTTGVILWSLAVWLVNAASFAVMLVAFGIDLKFAGVLLMQGLIMLGIAVPSTPGYVGVFEAPIVAVLTLYQLDHTMAATYAYSYHITTYLPITLLGAWSLIRTNIGLKQLRARTP